jgi:hypothetical protein
VTHKKTSARLKSLNKRASRAVPLFLRRAILVNRNVHRLSDFLRIQRFVPRVDGAEQRAEEHIAFL